MRRLPGCSGAKGFTCPLVGCLTRSEPFGQYKLTSELNWFDHVVGKHLGGYLFKEKRYHNLHRLGEAVLANQGQLRCLIGECSTKQIFFPDFQTLGAHLENFHINELDTLPVNSLWNQKTRKAGVPLSQLTAWAKGKRYQTRHGNGFVCQDHPNLRLNQTPETMGQHWLLDHLKTGWFCPVKTCSVSATPVFASIKDLYGHHIKTHMQEFLRNSQSKSCENGWLTEDELDLSLLEKAGLNDDSAPP